MGKPRINLRVRADVYALLMDASRRPGVTISAIVEKAVLEYFDPAEKARLEEKLIGRMDSFDARQGEIERDVALLLETTGHYVFYWLTRTDPIPEGERDAAHALGQRRFDFFIEQVARKVLDADGLSARISARLHAGPE